MRAGTGVDNIDLEAAWRAGVRVFTVPGASATAVAELAIGLTLAVSRRIMDAQRRIGDVVVDTVVAALGGGSPIPAAAREQRPRR
ncbi:hypothetical protein AB0H12_04010 [Actinosynnema sp. NPDC023794]